jgi:hypothetical protein
MKTNKALKQALALLAAITLTTIGAATANAAIVENFFQPLNLTAFDECTGESVHFTGQLHILSTVTINPNGSFHLHMTQNYAGVKGVGQTTGRIYQLPGELSVTENLTAAQVMTAVVFSNLITDGSPSNEKITVSLHITINANGTVTVDNVEFESITCTP